MTDEQQPAGTVESAQPQPPAPMEGAMPEQAQEDARASVSDPAELIRIAAMLQALLTEIHEITLDDAGRARLYDIHQRAVDAVKSVISEDLQDELANLALPLEQEDPSGPELRIAQAQLTGWIDGVLRGIQAAMMTQQMAAQRQLQQLQEQGRGEGPAAQGRQPGQYL